MERKTACVTGASGAIGKRIVKHLLEKGLRVNVLSRKNTVNRDNGVFSFQGDLGGDIDLTPFLNGADYLFHCAGEISDPSKMHAINVEGTRKIFEASKNVGLKYFCHISSAGVVGKTEKKLVDEECPCNPTNTYEKSKYLAEQKIGRAHV